MATIFDEGSVEVLAKALNILAETQQLIRVKEHSWQGLPTKDDIRQYAFALCGEVHELADELGWKDWQLPKAVDPFRASDEHADVLAFLGIIIKYTMDLADRTGMDLAAAYEAKTKVNLERLAGKVDGYGGYKVQERGLGSRGLKHQYYYRVDDPANNYSFWGLCTGYNAEADMYWFQELITGKLCPMPNGDSTWTATETERVNATLAQGVRG